VKTNERQAVAAGRRKRMNPPDSTKDDTRGHAAWVSGKPPDRGLCVEPRKN
jgi:hypothetical protein